MLRKQLNKKIKPSSKGLFGFSPSCFWTTFYCYPNYSLVTSMLYMTRKVYFHQPEMKIKIINIYNKNIVCNYISNITFIIYVEKWAYTGFPKMDLQILNWTSCKRWQILKKFLQDFYVRCQEFFFFFFFYCHFRF